MNSTKKNLIFASLCVIVIVLCEVFIFNQQTFITPGLAPHTQLDLSNAVLTGLEKNDDGEYESVEEDFTIELTDINVPMKTVHISLDFLSGYSADYTIDFADDTNASYYGRRGLIAGTVTDGYENSEHIYVQTSGNVHKIKINFTLPSKTAVCLADDAVELNTRIPMNFSFVRVLLIIFFVFLLRFLFKCGICNTKLGDCTDISTATTACIALVCVLIAFLMILSSSDGINDFINPRVNQINKELVDAFENGQIHLLREVEDELLALENPYDRSQRSGISAAWDHVMYNGKYYSYYGIAPVILLFLPYHLITGSYFPCNWAVFLFGALGLVFLALAFKKFMHSLFRDIPFGIYISCLTMLLASCGIWYCFVTPNFYEIAQNSGFAFVTLGAYLMFSSGILEQGKKINKVALGFSSASLSLAVLCRPTTAVWCVAAVAIIAYGFITRYKITSKLQKLSYLLASLLPFAFVGGVQMIYNYLRFDSFFDFGIQYSLTINDFTRSEFSTNLALIGFYNFLLAFPVINTKFPFIHANFSDLDINGYYYIANDEAIGIFFRALPTVFIFLAPQAYKKLEKKKRILPSLIWLLCTLILPAVVIFSIWESGYGVRYCVDFAWQMLLGAFVIMFLYYRGNEQKRNAVRNFTYISLALCLAVAMATTVEYMSGPGGFGQICDALADQLEFWH